MPTYDYRCEECGHAFERFQSITERPVRKCPVCGKRAVRRLIGNGAGVIFKGSGFYQTDYRSAEYRKRADSESSGSQRGDSSKSGEPKRTDSKAGESSGATESSDT